MAINDIVFFVAVVLTVLPVLYLIFTRNLIRAVFALVITLLGIACLYVMMTAEFVAVVQLLIYAGGVIVLLVFGIMLTKRITGEGVYTKHRAVVISSVILACIFGSLAFQIVGMSFHFADEFERTIDQTNQIGILLLTNHLVAFELIAFILLLSLVGAAFLAKKSNEL